MKISELAAYSIDNFHPFPKLASGNKIPKHLMYISKAVQREVEREPSNEKNKLIIISLPPRHGKTELISKHFVPWFLGKNPKKRVILTSYSSDLSDSNSSAAKEKFEQWSYDLWNIKPSSKMFNRTAWDTEQGGGCISAGVGGATTGFGADLFIIDDYVKNQEESESKVIRNKIWEWWQSVAATRFHPNATGIIIATRWHDDDLIGRLLKQAKKEGEDFPFELTEITLSATAEKNDLLGREEGAALWPKRYSEKRLKHIRATVGEYYWNALYKGDPVDRGGTLFRSDNFRYYEYDIIKDCYYIYRSDEKDPIKVMARALNIIGIIDPAIEIKTKNDPSGMLAVAYCPYNNIWLILDALCGRIEHNKLMSTFDNFCIRNKARIGYAENEKLGKVLVKQSFGATSIPMKEISHKGLDKYARATPMATHIENERVFFPKGARWLHSFNDPNIPGFESQLTGFPNIDCKAMVDCLAYADILGHKISIAEVLAGRNN